MLGLVLAGSAGAVLPQQSGLMDLTSDANQRIGGGTAVDLTGVSVAGVGDVNGDGFDDVTVGAYGARANGRQDSGSVYLVLGREPPADIVISSPDAPIVRIDGAAQDDRVGVSVAGAGDVNGDGRDDLILGATGADNNGRDASGSAYVIFGTPSPVDIDLAALGSAGFRIDGAAPGDLAGESVAGAGDVNGDGRDDLIVGALVADGNGTNAGTAYVIYGRGSTSPVDLAALGSAGFRIDGAAPGDLAGDSVAGAGDVNGDGRDDLIVGASGVDTSSGAAYVVYGPAGPADIDLGALGPAGFRMAGGDSFDNVGISVAGIGDVNADGRSDVIVGADGADAYGRANSGTAYVVYGTAAGGDVDLTALGASGFRIGGAADNDRAGTSVSGVEDVNGDGLRDVIVGAPFSDTGGSNAGSAYVVYGRSSGADVDLANPATAALRADGRTGDAAGFSVAGAGDVNGDDRADVIAGAPTTIIAAIVANSGSAYVVYGFGAPSITYPPALLNLGQPATLTPTVRRTGPASFSVSPPLPGGLALDAATGVISGTPTSAGTSSHTVTMSDLTGNAQASLAITVAPAGTVAGGLPAGALCATPAPVATSAKGRIALTTTQLAINQRIGQAAIRRLNAIEAWLNAGIVTDDICGGGLGAAEFAPSITTAAGPAQAITPARPRALTIAPAAKKNATFTLSAAQLLINQRIYQAALRRSRGLAARLGGTLTGGDLTDAQITTAKLALGIVITAASPAPPPAASATVVAPRSGGNPGKVTLSAAQLAINQKIAQAGVRGANDLRAQIQTGLSGANFSDATLTAADLAPGVAP